MTRIVDDIVLDPIEVSPGRTELSLSEMGLSVTGADFGEAAIEGTSVRQQFGEVLVDRRPKTKTVALRLRVREDAEADLETAAYRLQQKVGLLHREGGWLRRDFHIGEFAGSLLCKIVGEVTLADFAGWQAGDSPDVTLTLVAGPIWYSTEVEESPLFVEESGRALVYELPETKGTAEGLKRITVTNKNSSGDWRGLIWAEECRDFQEGDTAKLLYEAEALTLKGGASVKSLAGASGGQVVEHSALTAGWLNILESKIVASGHMTHLGPRRIKMRIYDPGTSPGGIELRLLWRVLGSSRWNEGNAIVPTPLVGNFAIVDLGECRPQRAALGEQRWEWKLMARAPDGSGAIRVDQVYVLPTEQYLELTAPDESRGAYAQSTKTPGTILSSSPGSVVWSGMENVKTSNNVYATVSLSKNEPTSQYLQVTNFGFGLPEAVEILGIIVTIEKSASPSYIKDSRVSLVKKGSVQATNKALASPWPGSDENVTYGSASDLWGSTWSGADINASNFGVVIAATNSYDKDSPKKEARVDSVQIAVYYKEPIDENRVCFAQRSVELRWDGNYRENLEGDVWGPLVADGLQPVATPSALEGRPTRGIVIPSQGDLGELSDGESNKLNARVRTRAGYHFAREAAP